VRGSVRVVVISLALALTLPLGGCGGAAKTGLVKQKSDVAPKYAESDKRRTGKATAGKAAGPASVDRPLDDPAPKDRSEDVPTAAEEEGRPAAIVPDREERIRSEERAPPAMDPAPSRDYDDAPIVAEAAGGGGAFEGDTWEGADKDDAHDEVSDLEEAILEEIEDYTDDHGVQSHSQRGTATCAEVCDLSRAICKSSSRICAISSQNPSDGWISGRCTWSKGECGKSEERCTVCNP
jgi:hypothetical protein